MVLAKTLAIEIKISPESSSFKESQKLIEVLPREHKIDLIFFVGEGVMHAIDSSSINFWQAYGRQTNNDLILCSSSWKKAQLKENLLPDGFILGGQIQALQVKKSVNYVLSF